MVRADCARATAVLAAHQCDHAPRAPPPQWPEKKPWKTDFQTVLSGTSAWGLGTPADVPKKKIKNFSHDSLLKENPPQMCRKFTAQPPQMCGRSPRRCAAFCGLPPADVLKNQKKTVGKSQFCNLIRNYCSCVFPRQPCDVDFIGVSYPVRPVQCVMDRAFGVDGGCACFAHQIATFS